MRSLGVLITGFMFAACSIPAISVELTSLQVSGERAMLERNGINTRRSLVLPRVLESVLGVAILDLSFVNTALLAATAALSGRLDLLAVERVISATAPIKVFGSVVRAGLFAGLAVVWTQRFAEHGRRELPELPLATSRVVLQSIVLVLQLEASFQLVSAWAVPA